MPSIPERRVPPGVVALPAPPGTVTAPELSAPPGVVRPPLGRRNPLVRLPYSGGHRIFGAEAGPSRFYGVGPRPTLGRDVGA